MQARGMFGTEVLAHAPPINPFAPIFPPPLRSKSGGSGNCSHPEPGTKRNVRANAGVSWTFASAKMRPRESADHAMLEKLDGGSGRTVIDDPKAEKARESLRTIVGLAP